jgi:hypothetical protein
MKLISVVLNNIVIPNNSLFKTDLVTTTEVMRIQEIIFVVIMNVLYLLARPQNTYVKVIGILSSTSFKC